MSLTKLNKAKDRLDYYNGMLTDITQVLESEHPIEVLKRKQRTYQQYVALYEKKFSQALDMLK